MLSAELQEIFVNNRRLDKPPVHNSHMEAVLGQDQYQNLIASLVDNRLGSYFFSLLFIIQYAKEIRISSTTACLAKILLDIVLTKSNFIDDKTLLMSTLCCVWIATKLNEPSKVSSCFSPEVICQHGHHQFSAAEVIELQKDILELLEYRLNYTTPYDYIEPFFQTFPWLKKVKTVIGQLIDFSITLPQLAHQRSEYIFYSCFLAICHIKDVTLSPLQKSIVSCQVQQIQLVEELKGHIVEAYKQIEASDEENPREDNIQIELE